MLPRIIGVCGAIGAGKSTVAKLLTMHAGYKVVPFAQPLKNMLMAVGLKEDDVNGYLKQTPHPSLCGKTPREAMQLLGTEWGRNLIGEDIWLRLWRDTIRNSGRVVVDDARFLNEFDEIRSQGGKIVLVERAAHTQPDHQHVSEMFYRNAQADAVIINDALSIEALRDEIRNLLTAWAMPQPSEAAE